MKRNLSHLRTAAILLALATIAPAAAAARLSEPLASIPYNLDGKLMLVDVSINGSAPVTFIVDTGASHTVFDPKFARELGLEIQSAPPTSGTGTGDVEKSITKPARMT